MTFKLKSMAAVAVLAAFSLAAAGCGGGGGATNTTTTTTNTASAGDAGTAASTTTTTTTTASNANLPAECQTYLNEVQACLDHVTQANPAAAPSIRSAMDQQRAAWASVPPAQMAQSCTAALNMWNQSMKAAMGCNQ